jgi:hypothetical protein
MMALTIYPYPMPGGTPQLVPDNSATFLIPVGSNDLSVFVIAPPSLFGALEFGISYSLDVSTDGGATFYTARSARITAGQGEGLVPGHAVDLPPGEIPEGRANFAWEREQSARVDINEFVRRSPSDPTRVRLDSGTVFARLIITPLAGNDQGPNVMVAGVAECYDIDGNVVPIDPGTLR